jgi:ribosome assembly protein 1
MTKVEITCLQRCLKDLRERFAQVEIQASKPIVPFRETAVKAPGMLIFFSCIFMIIELITTGLDMHPQKTPGAPRGTIRGTSSSNVVAFTLRAQPIPEPVLTFILQNLASLKALQSTADEQQVMEQEGGEVLRTPSVKPEHFWDALDEVCRRVGGEWSDVVDKIWAFGPQGAGSCLLIDARKNSAPRSYVIYVFFPSSSRNLYMRSV